MKKFLHSTSLLLLSWCLLLVGTQQARATHIQGGQLTYVNVGNNQYVVTLYLYRDCSATATLPTSMSLLVKNGCTGTTQGTYPMNPVPNSIAVGTQYCPAQQQASQCVSTAQLPNYQTQQYRTATVTITPGQWLLSTEICCRPSTANLDGQANFRYEASLNNLITLADGQTRVIQNNSAQYSPQDVPVPFVSYNQSTTIGFNTTDPDNTRANPDQDSLAYSLTTPLKGCNLPVDYSNYPGGFPTPHPTIPGCFILPPANTPTLFTAQLPIAVGFNTTGACPILQGTTNLFAFNAAAGQFTFTPNVYRNTAPGLGENKYVVVGRVDDYRKLPGSNRRYLVGSVRREIFVIVINSSNTVPSAPTGTPVTPNAGTTVVQTVDSLDVTIQPCNYSQVLVRFSDPDPTDLLTVSYTGAGTIPVDILQSGDIGTYTLTGNGTRNPVARFLFQPSPAYSGRVLRIPFQIQDDACPVRGLQTRILVVRIASTRRDLATSATVAGAPGLGAINTPGLREASICPGGSLQLVGTVTRPDSTRGRLQTYNYTWTGNGIQGNANQAVVTVRPLTTTMYRLQVNPTSGFQTGVCADIDSILVRVVAEPEVAVVASNADVCPNGEITLTATASRPNDALVDNYTYEWFDANNQLLNQTGNTVTVRPTGPTSYTVRAKGALAYGCDASNSINLNVAPVAVASFDTVNVVAISSRAGSRSLIPPVTFKFTNTSRLNPINSAYQLDSVRWTYQRVRTASGEPVTSLPVRFSTSRTEATTPPLEPGYYLIKLTVNTRAAGTNCPEATAQYTVFVPNIQVPNIITPNGDNFNDFFVVNADQKGGKLEIFNRWGRKVQEYGNYQNNWNGEGQSDGVYYYYLTDRQGNKTKGWVEIVRGGN
ncbi:gliding motility-associated C-terminal domain-containing protein [Hymenobacter sp. ASUV-10]|uniref:Gliding motility-associated C-terminal domain-containing protein n=1 Tax=Hymenobacter aranciens TaxID=3063996 RepID=A0ABT9B8K2_9BACT|nr:gliding motility-associated C-terminal domain-containing protein [Hymenobacter sp. ASUV-10]MDO7874590.1 gliding motility-associated C-terminal domain-containing protein [Hymenobacter sp. ASUV-10]